MTTELIVRRNKKGRGLYAGRDFRKGTVLLEDHVIVFPDDEAIRSSVVHKYTFTWIQDGASAIALGLGSLINHSYEPNVIYQHLWRRERIRFIAHRSIRKGDEIVMNYNHDPDDKRSVGFRVKR